MLLVISLKHLKGIVGLLIGLNSILLCVKEQESPKRERKMGGQPLRRTVQFSSVQSLSVRLFVTPWAAAGQASRSNINSWSLLKLMTTESVMSSNHLILCPPLLFLPSVFHSIRDFSSESVLCIRWPKFWSFSFSISPSSEYSGLISFRIDWLDLLAVQGTLKSFLQHHNSKSINSLMLSFLYGPTVTSIHDYQKNHSFDQMDLCRQSKSSVF